ncbi:MAG: phosphopantetheine-binding protein [Polyangiales bacterium]
MDSAQARDHSDQIRELIAEQLHVSIDAVDPTRQLIEDLGADLLSLAELALALEDVFDIDIPDEEWIDMESVSQVVAYVSSLIDAKQARH